MSFFDLPIQNLQKFPLGPFMSSYLISLVVARWSWIPILDGSYNDDMMGQTLLGLTLSLHV